MVEDEPFFQSLLQFSLRQCGYEVDVAENGLDALNHCKFQDYDLVVTDVIMPFMNGFELIHELKRQRPLQKVVVVTSLEGDVVEPRLHKFSHLSWLHKPLAPNALQEATRLMLQAS